MKITRYMTDADIILVCGALRLAAEQYQLDAAVTERELETLRGWRKAYASPTNSASKPQTVSTW